MRRIDVMFCVRIVWKQLHWPVGPFVFHEEENFRPCEWDTFTEAVDDPVYACDEFKQFNFFITSIAHLLTLRLLLQSK